MRSSSIFTFEPRIRLSNHEESDRQIDHRHRAKEKEEQEIESLEKMATEQQIAAFQQRLDDYDTKTVDALMENGKALDKLGKELRQMRDNSFVLPDGRHVFKTEDGTRVFDEKGAEISPKALDPNIIGEHCTRWETFDAAHRAEQHLNSERHDLLEFQGKVDETRARVDKGGISKKELDALDADLKANAPPAIRQRLGLPALNDDQTAKISVDFPSSIRDATVIDSAPRRDRPMPAPM